MGSISVNYLKINIIFRLHDCLWTLQCDATCLRFFGISVVHTRLDSPVFPRMLSLAHLWINKMVRDNINATCNEVNTRYNKMQICNIFFHNLIFF